MEVTQQRFFADEGQRVREMRAEPPDDALVRVEAVELGGRREEGTGEGEVLHAHTISIRHKPPWVRGRTRSDGERTLLGRAISIKVCRGQM